MQHLHRALGEEAVAVDDVLQAHFGGGRQRRFGLHVVGHAHVAVGGAQAHVQRARGRHHVVLEGVFDEHLHAERGHGGAAHRLGRKLVFDQEVVAEAGFVEGHVGVHELQFLGQGHGGAVAAQQHVAVHVGKLLHEILGFGVGIVNQRRKRVEGIEQKVRVELALQGLQLALNAGAGQGFGALQVAFPLAKKVGAFVKRRHHKRGQQVVKALEPVPVARADKRAQYHLQAFRHHKRGHKREHRAAEGLHDQPPHGLVVARKQPAHEQENGPVAFPNGGREHQTNGVARQPRPAEGEGHGGVQQVHQPGNDGDAEEAKPFVVHGAGAVGRI